MKNIKLLIIQKLSQMKNIKLTLLGTAALLIAVGLNIRHALNDYGVRDNKLHVEVLAQSNTTTGSGSNSGGSSSSSPNYSYLKELEAIECTISKINGAVAIIYKGLVIPAYAQYTIYGSKKACTFWPFSKCDQSQVTFCQEIGTGTSSN